MTTYSRIYYAKNRSRILTYLKSYRKRDSYIRWRKQFELTPERINKRRLANRLWKQRNRDKVRIARRKYNKEHSRQQKKVWFERISKRDGAQCKLCGSKTRLTLQHKRPASIGGRYSYDNLEILCLPCNIKDYHQLVKLALKHYFDQNY